MVRKATHVLAKGRTTIDQGGSEVAVLDHFKECVGIQNCVTVCFDDIIKVRMLLPDRDSISKPRGRFTKLSILLDIQIRDISFLF